MTSTQFIAKEGYKGLIVIIICVLFFLWLGWGFLIFLSFLSAALWLFAFRNPERLPEDRLNSIVLAPIDGRIIGIDAQGDFICIMIEVDWLDVGILRAPVDVLSSETSKKNGLFLKFSKESIKNILNTKITFSSKSNYSFNIELFPEIFSSASIYEKTDFCANDRMGFMKLGRLDFKFPSKFLDLKIDVGDKIKGGQTLIGYIK
ncbi:hypothetical protein BKH41_02650 [Helicobacter sp. 12S02232-10]|uniref:phosphatidylserine decarboxylase n=1 Tax=Helicobacter sp. 12S02232-10 TaxID=1476197 RepID=UPI000BA7859E|nr:phosphatidylserine decarboxylase [Helicobacter sp. 12S02232-10]PAF49582.1 hypothetical protein BKH41_02650 [Helicobacter sp. 12S02232-10]